MNGCCYIVGSAPFKHLNIELKEDDYVIAADGGYDILCNKGICPNVVIGDLDSTLKADVITRSGIPVIKLPKEKDDTDMAVCVRHGIKEGYSEFIIYGALGGRLDHTIANLQLIANMSANGVKVKLIGDNEEIIPLTDASISFPKDMQGVISVFSHSETSYGVTIKGLKYEVQDVELSNNVALGVSNEFVGHESLITVTKGTLIIIHNR